MEKINHEELFKNYFNRLRNLLPLKVVDVNFSNPEFSIDGEIFGFATLAAWRISKEKNYLCGSSDSREDIFNETFSNLSGSEIFKIDYQSDNLKVDPVFYFSNGYVIEIFSTYGDETWCLNSPCGFMSWRY